MDGVVPDYTKMFSLNSFGCTFMSIHPHFYDTDAFKDYKYVQIFFSVIFNRVSLFPLILKGNLFHA